MSDVANANAAGLLWHQGGRAGCAIAIIEQDREVTYGALRDRAASIGGALARRGVAPNDRVAILLERGSEAAATFFGVLALGGIAVVIHEALRPRQIEHVLAHAGARYLVTSADLLARHPRNLNTTARVMDVAGLRDDGATLAPLPRTGGHIAQLIYTSGSTGLPKGVIVTHANVRAAAETVARYLRLTSHDRLASLLSFSFVYGMSQLLCATTAGATLVVERSPLAQAVVETIARHRITVLAAVPPLWLRLLRLATFHATALPSLRVLTNAGGHLPVDAVRALRRAHPAARLYLMYGLTEALRCSYLPPSEVDRRPDSIGRAIRNGTIAVLRDDGTPAVADEVGELVFAGPTVTLGYWGDAALTAGVFRRVVWGGRTVRAVFTGDLVRRDQTGLLFYVGRKDRIIKTMGYRVGPDEVADALYASGEVAEAAVLGEPDPMWGARVVAHVVLGVGGSADRLRAYCHRELPSHLQPARIEIRDALPLLPSGKHDVAALAGV